MDCRHPIWVGERIRLRTFAASDWKAYSDWNEDSDQARGLYFVPFPRSKEGDRAWAEREVARERQGDDFRFAIEDKNGQVVGDLSVHHTDRRTDTFNYGVSVAREHRRRGYASEAILLVLRSVSRQRGRPSAPRV